MLKEKIHIILLPQNSAQNGFIDFFQWKDRSIVITSNRIIARKIFVSDKKNIDSTIVAEQVLEHPFFGELR